MDWTRQAGPGAETYHRFLVPAMFERCAEELLDACDPPDGGRVLDVACGTGVATRAAARRLGPAGAVLGVDLGEPMLAIARGEGAPDAGAPIEYEASEALSLPVASGSFDGVLCQHGLQFFPDRAAAVAEMARAARPGATVALACWRGLEENPAFAALVRALGDHLGEDPAAMMAMPFSVGAGELERLLAGAGLADVEVDAVAWSAEFPAPREHFARLALLSGPIAPIFADAPETARDALGDQVAAELEPYDAGDELHAPIATWIATGRRPEG